MRSFIIMLIALLTFISGVATFTARADAPFEKLRLTGMYACDDDRIFRVRNSNSFDVPYTWRSTSTGETGSAVAEPGDNFLTNSGGNTTFIIRWDYNGNNGQQVKSSNNTQNCPTPDPVPTPNVEPVTSAEVVVPPPPVFDDDRCNPDPWATAVLYFNGDQYDMYGIIDGTGDGYYLFSVAVETIDLENLPEEAQLLGEMSTIYDGYAQLWQLPTGELQIQASAFPSDDNQDDYVYIFSIC